MPNQLGSSVLAASEFCESLRLAGIVLEATSATTLAARPRAAVTEAIAAAITYHKPALLRVLKGGAPATPSVCRFCTMEFVSVAGQNCGSCVRLLGLPFRFAPGSVDEAVFVAAFEKRISTEVTGPTVPRRNSHAS